MPRVRPPARVTGRGTRERKRKEEKRKEKQAENEDLTIPIMPAMIVIAASCLFGDGSIVLSSNATVTRTRWHDANTVLYLILSRQEVSENRGPQNI